MIIGGPFPATYIRLGIFDNLGVPFPTTCFFLGLYDNLGVLFRRLALAFVSTIHKAGYSLCRGEPVFLSVYEWRVH